MPFQAQTKSRMEERLHSPGPRRLLALDGVGGRNAVTFPILKAMESALQQEAENSELRLCDYFDARQVDVSNFSARYARTPAFA